MKKVVLCLSLVLFMGQVGHAEFVEGDGTLDLICEDQNVDATPHNTFDFTLMYDNGVAQTALKLAYKLVVLQYPFYGAESLVIPQVISGCEAAALDISIDEVTGIFTASFECAGDGDAGYGTINIDPAGSVTGKLSFPEGQSGLWSPIVEDTEIALNCRFK